ncbi:MAG: DUF4173 domain-containing protein [Clostridia bacterium]|nr:DUF4173 domain-containing protein [Clostridia bacterium]
MENKIENNLEAKAGRAPVFGSRSLDLSAVIISIIVGAAFSLLVIKEYIGINLFLFSLIAISGIGYILYKDDNLDIKNFVFFGGAFIVYASYFLRLRHGVFNGLTIVILVGLLVITSMFSSKRSAEKGVLTYLYRQFGPVARIDKIFAGFAALKKSDNQKAHKSLQIILGVLISIVLLIIVIPLMMSAEAAFESFIQNVVDKIKIDFDLTTFFWKIIAGGAIAIIFCGFLFTFTRDKMIGSKKAEKAVDGKDNHALILTVLFIMGTVFLFFAVIQFGALFASRESIVEKSTFAQTAREGYFQLVVLSIINFIMVLVFNRAQRGSNKLTGKIIKYMTTYFTLLNVYLLASSAYKMTLYYNAYGLSVDRLLVYILLVYEFIAIVLLTIKIYKPDMKFFTIMVYFTVGFWAIVSLINIQGWVADSNLNRYKETGKIDVEYITWLSDDVSSQVKELYFDNYDKLTVDERYRIVEYYYKRPFTWDNSRPKLSIEDITKYKDDEAFESWLAFNISRSKSYADGLEVLEDFISKN